MMHKETNKRKYRQRRWIMTALFLAVAVTGFLYARRQPGMLAEEAGTDGETLTFHAEVSLRYHYALCGHDMEQEADARRYIGLTQEQLTEEFPGYAVKKFSPDQAILQKQYPCYCPSHILAYLEGEEVVLKQCTAFEENFEEVQRISIRAEQLSAEDREALMAGKVFADANAAKSFLAPYQVFRQEQH